MTSFYVLTHSPTNTFVLLVKNKFLCIFSTDTKLHLEKNKHSHCAQWNVTKFSLAQIS